MGVKKSKTGAKQKRAKPTTRKLSSKELAVLKAVDTAFSAASVRPSLSAWEKEEAEFRQKNSSQFLARAKEEANLRIRKMRKKKL
jgi:hypothetical protein